MADQRVENPGARAIADDVGMASELEEPAFRVVGVEFPATRAFAGRSYPGRFRAG
ncbi:MAG: hypothetical protein ACREFW_00815 [Rhizomicrobium sp.]